MYLIVGLGNPGRQYEKTRHNVGFDVIDRLADHFGVKLDKLKFKGSYAQFRYENEKIILLKPETFMNASGESVQPFMNYFGIEPENLIVIVDDIDIKFGTVRIRANGSAGTHNGLKSVINRINNKNFTRIKLAVNQKPTYMDLADFVLSKFTDSERKIVDKEVELAKDAVLEILKSDVNTAMNKINSIELKE
ncbi:aminoacyl-tRNA hydrolase [Helcococcus kunzii]|uniref:aminoacyl-tRNA hydrolase n=1 Tax=Helcococcus kunzii TaxID=40091 RepID=UPI0024ADA4B0|nr:aminoacyl-tRNA hydrolase [Helcococcus kunzii]